MISLHCEVFAYDDSPDEGPHFPRQGPDAPAGTGQGRKGAALRGTALDVAPGELVVVVGASGSGKTTLAHLLAGQTGRDAGSVFRGTLALDGQRLDFSGTDDDPRIDPAAWSARVGFVAQSAWSQLSLMSATVGEEIAFGPANHGVPVDRLRETVAAVAGDLGLTGLLDRDPRRLSGGQLRRTVIAGAVAARPGILVLDEPYQGLDPEAAREVAAVLDGLRDAGTGVVLLQPLLPQDAPPGTRILALDGGRQVFSGSLAEARDADLARHGIGTEGEPPRFVPAPHPKPITERIPLAQLSRVHFTYPQPSGEPPAGLHGVDLTVFPGEIIALTGANGSGKSTLLKHFNGLLRPSAGSVRLAGGELGGRSVGELARTAGYLFQDTDQQLFERTVLREVAYGPSAAGSSRETAQTAAHAALEAVGLENRAQSHPYELGFVERRLVALASLIATGPVLWVLDEPTAGLDERGRNLLARVLADHAAAGGGAVLATHDTEFARAVCHRIGRLIGGTLRFPPSFPPRGAHPR